MEAVDRQTLPETSAAVATLVPFKVASFSTYAEAQRAVDFLSDHKFPVEYVTIVAEGLKFVEQVTGRLNWGKAALNGAIVGAGTGLLIGFFFGLLSLITSLVSSFILALYGFVIGGVVGAMIGLIFYALSGGERDFTSIGSLQAEHYNVLVESPQAEEAKRLLELS